MWQFLTVGDFTASRGMLENPAPTVGVEQHSIHLEENMEDLRPYTIVLTTDEPATLEADVNALHHYVDLKKLVDLTSEFQEIHALFVPTSGLRHDYSW
ncbi:hypothetical protein VP1G_11296 [Cytospora mali]|uniref:Uncharacterized protein n=1 Tax=Cytospora mali TaxID=578113 RepID=A0A194VC92_CYTMA|nr:hypothetical protein VP1G_11296 [Valsa mali var. pyri (nom. inval.)]